LQCYQRASTAITLNNNNNKRPGILRDNSLVEASLQSLAQRVAFKAAQFPHSGDWLFSLAIGSCGLGLDDEDVRVAIALRLGLPVCIPLSHTSVTVGPSSSFSHIVLESLGPMHKSARQFLVDLGCRITSRSGDDREGSFLFQRISILLHDSSVSVHCSD